MPSWNDLGTAFTTLRELDVSAIRDESERPLLIAVVGPRSLYSQVFGLLRFTGNQRYPATERMPFVYYELASSDHEPSLHGADLILVLADASLPLRNSENRALAQLAALQRPMVIAICGAAHAADYGAPRPEFAHAQIVLLPELASETAAATLGQAMLEQMPDDLRLAVARALPALRSLYAQELVRSVAKTNATYALASSIPEQIPILAVPFAAADILVLTKNQALMVYRMALAFGAPPEFQARMGEIAPVIGGAFVWRQVARTLISLIPVWGVIPKVSIAYAGTYSVGFAAERWYADGEVLSGQRMKLLADEAMRMGYAFAAPLVHAARERSAAFAAQRPQRRWPWQKHKDALPPPDEGEER